MPIVLVVDDSAVDRRLAGGLLSKTADLQVEYAADGVEALARLDAGPVQVVVTDMVMPGMNGLELVRAILEKFPALPVILMTGKGSEDTAVKALQAGAAHYVPKSALHHQLVPTVESVLAVAQEKRLQQRLLSCLSRSEFAFSLDNDPELIPAFIGYVQNVLTNSGLVDQGASIRVSIALEEALRNAMFHGNLEISSAQRDGDPEIYQRILTTRLVSDPYQQRRLSITVRIETERATFVIRDDGPGFDPTKLPDPTDPENLEKVSGRGLLLMKTFMDEVAYNSTGNQVTLVKNK
jgi:CheY-like chemotaxis protein